MKKWISSPERSARDAPVHLLSDLIARIDSPGFNLALLEILRPVLPAGSFSIYRSGRCRSPRLFMSGSLGIPDTTRDCWRAYLSGPHLDDNSLVHGQPSDSAAFFCHVAAEEMPSPHRQKVYDAHGISERISIIEQTGTGSFAVNFYRHYHQAAFTGEQITAFETLAPALLAVVKKSIELSNMDGRGGEAAHQHWRRKLKRLNPGLTDRELDVCSRMLTGMTNDGIACDLGLGVPTVKTYRNRAFDRLGINFRNELFALVLSANPDTREDA